MNENHPKVFISYSWEDVEHKDWVKLLADSLLKDGIDVHVDQYDLTLGDRLPEFMEKSISDADYVLIICTPSYKAKSDMRKGGVGYEGHIISGELFDKGNERKFIPIIRKGTSSTAIPTYLTGKLGIDLSDEKRYEDSYKDLLTTLYGVKSKPPVGSRPTNIAERTKDNTQKDTTQDEPIYILGIITDEVTVPSMDGTPGSALYEIPFRLSKKPSYLWSEIFVASWNSPPSFTSMHRPGIASVYGDKIILDGTTIEEVRDYHRATLLLCVDIANKQEAAIIAKERQKREQEEQRRNQHFAVINDIANNMKF